MHPAHVRSDAALHEILQRIERDTEICLDCEFHSEGRYYPKLCLVQLAFGAELWAIDPHRVKLAALAPLLESETVIKVLHDGRQDLPILARAVGIAAIRGVFDTQIAAAFSGYGSSIGYGLLVQEICGVQLDKSLQVSDWSRELSDAQIEYALDDVRYLGKVASELRLRLAAQGRADWATAACEQAVSRALRRPDPEKLYLRVASVSRLSSQQLGILREIAKWRDHVAEALDKPVPNIANDLGLKSIALRPPRDLASLENVRGLGVGRGQPWANQLLAAIAVGISKPEPKPKIPLPSEQESRIEGMASLLGTARRFVAIRDGIAAELLANQAELRALAEWYLNERPSDVSFDVLEGWRRALLGDLLLLVLAGEVAFRADEGAPSGIGLVQLPLVGLDGAQT